ncbi:MAG: DUF58 domain-containing protein [Alphaproteobacteria bacterium]|nr:DUF58 domain-containing protein [Alphaproteobacteria bacterium]
MPTVRLLKESESRTGQRHQNRARELAHRFSALSASAKLAAASVMHGVHGRRQAGIGETFWQFRPFAANEAVSRIDWRRSAKDDRLYVREREWESAKTVMLWIDRSVSMRFQSSLAFEPKVDRALVLGLAIADLLVRGGEQAGLLGLTPAFAIRQIIERFAEVLLADEKREGYIAEELPAKTSLPRGAQALLISDFLSDPDAIAATVKALSAQGALGHLVLISDPVEESFPFSGNVEFADVDSDARMRFGQAERLRDTYQQRLMQHRDSIASIARYANWSMMTHRTDRPATEALLMLRTKLEVSPAIATPQRREAAR